MPLQKPTEAFTREVDAALKYAPNWKQLKLLMTDKKVWLISGAGCGLGLDVAKAALADGHVVVSTGRNPTKVAAAIGHHGDLLAVQARDGSRRCCSAR